MPTATSCTCSATLRWLCEHGGRHACFVREHGRSEETWTENDWLHHFAEEERLYFRFLPPKVAARLTAEHVMFRAQLRRTGRVDMKAMQEHAEIEDFYARRMVR